MHTTLYVTISKSRAETNKAARKYVYQFLYNDEQFSQEDEVGNSVGIADWFVIGGRTSDDLAILSRPDGEHESLGSQSDAGVVGEQLYRRILAQVEGKTQVKVGGDLTFWDLDNQPVSKESHIGKKWLVVVDYHS